MLLILLSLRYIWRGEARALLWQQTHFYVYSLFWQKMRLRFRGRNASLLQGKSVFQKNRRQTKTCDYLRVERQNSGICCFCAIYRSSALFLHNLLIYNGLCPRPASQKRARNLPPTKTIFNLISSFA